MKASKTLALSFLSLIMTILLGGSYGCCKYKEVQSDYGLNHNIPFCSDKKGVLSIRERWMIRNYDWLQEVSNDSLALFRRKGKYGYLNTHTGKIKIPARYSYAWPFSEGLAAVQKNGLIGFIDHNGLFVIEPQYSAYNSSLSDYSFQNGFCVVSSLEGKYGIIDKMGSWILKPEYNYASVCKDYAIIAIDGKRMQVSYDGTVLNTYILDEIVELSYYCGDRYDYNEEIHYVRYYSYCIGGRWGLMDEHCNRLTEPLYSSISALNEKVFCATLLDEGSIILLNTKGEIIE